EIEGRAAAWTAECAGRGAVRLRLLFTLRAKRRSLGSIHQAPFGSNKAGPTVRPAGNSSQSGWGCPHLCLSIAQRPGLNKASAIIVLARRSGHYCLSDNETLCRGAPARPIIPRKALITLRGCGL